MMKLIELPSLSINDLNLSNFMQKRLALCSVFYLYNLNYFSLIPIIILLIFVVRYRGV